MPVRPNGVRTFAIAAPVFPQIGHSIVPVSTAPAHLQDGLYALPSTVFTVATLATLQPLAPTSTLLNRRQFDTTEENGHTACTVCGQAATHTDVITHILGQWTSVTAWCLIFYSVGSVFLLLWFWSIGWIDRRLSPTRRFWGLRHMTSYPHYYDRPLPPLPNVSQVENDRLSGYYYHVRPVPPIPDADVSSSPWNQLEADARRERQQDFMHAELRRVGMI